MHPLTSDLYEPSNSYYYLYQFNFCLPNPESPTPSQKSNNHRFGSITTATPSSTSDDGMSPSVTSIIATRLELDGLWAWEDEELLVCQDDPPSPGKLPRKQPGSSSASIRKSDTTNQFHEVLQSSPELTSSLCQVLEKSHWGMVI